LFEMRHNAVIWEFKGRKKMNKTRRFLFLLNLFMVELYREEIYQNYIRNIYQNFFILLNFFNDN
jgi:hypothetical protein